MTGRVRGLLFIAALAVLLAPAYAAAKDNYCGECHTAREISSFGSLTRWDRSIYQQKDTLCPGLFDLKKEQYFTESRLLKYDNFLTVMEEQTRRYPEYLREDLVKYGVQYADLKSQKNIDSIDAFAVPNLKIKKNMGDLYTTFNKLREDYKMEKVIGLGLLAVVIISLLFFLGLKKTVKE